MTVAVGGKKQPLPAKLVAPAPTNVVRRERLFRELDAAHTRPVVWIHAPAGAGKTMLVSSWLAEHDIKPLWYQFDARDADLATFFACLRTAVGRLSPRKRETLPLLTPEYAFGLPVFARNFFEQLFARMRSPAVLVLDNYQEISELASLHELLAQAVDLIPAGVRLVCISRSDPPAAFARARAERKLLEIGADAMNLTPDEALAIGRACSPRQLSDQTIETLNRQADGWMAGLILLLENADGDISSPFPEQSKQHIFDYFAAEIMRKSAPEIQEFLSRCSLLPTMDTTMAQTLTGNSDARDILHSLARRNYFISRRRGAATRYEFHPLFRAFLASELERRHPPEKLREMQRQAGQILIQAGELDAAVELLRRADDFRQLIPLLLDHAERMIMSGRFQTLSEWLRTIPESMRNEQPWLEYWLAVSRFPFDPVEARTHFEQAYRRFELLADPAGLYLSWAGIAEAFNLMWDDFTDMLPWLEEYGELRKRYPDFPSDSVAANVQAALFGVLIFLQPQHPESTIAREAVEKLLRDAPEPDFRIKVVTNLALYYSWSGTFVDMRRVVEAGEAIIANEPVSPLSRIMVKVSRGTLCWITGDPVGAHEAIRDALEIAEQSGVRMLDSYLLAQSVYASGIRNNPAEMAETLDIIKKHLSPARRIDIAHYYFQMSWYETLRGNFSEALEFIRQTMNLLVHLSAQMPLALGRMGMAKALIHTGEYAEADLHLNLALEFALTLPSRHFEFIGRMIRSYSWLLQHQEEKCAAELKRALAIASRECDYWTFPLWDPKLVSPLCAVALQRGIEIDYVRALIRKWRLSPESTSVGSALWPWPVRINALDGFSLFIDDKPAPLSARIQNKALEMLKVLIALGGSNVSEQQLCDALWPNSEGDMAYQNFKVTLYRLRKLVGQEAVVLKKGLLSLNDRFVRVDIDDFERLLSTLETVSDTALPQAALEAVALYPSTTTSEEHAWLITMRERVRDNFLKAVEHIAERLCQLGYYPEAAECYQKAIEVEPLGERFYRGLISCHYHQGHAAEAMMVFRQCQDVLSRELGISPSTQTLDWQTKLTAIQ